ncbi:hypothetical protein ACHQM5_001725 [Ranunculus cassubicifolius]
MEAISNQEEMQESSVGGEESQVVVPIVDLVESMESKIEEMRRLSQGSSRCIFKVNQSVGFLYRKVYRPEILSVGPYYHGDARFRMAEAHKWHFLGTMLSRNLIYGLRLQHFIDAIRSIELEIRDSYEGEIKFGSDQFVEMMVLDGCFIIELLLRIKGYVETEANDSILAKRWTLPILTRDLIKVENQIPFLVLSRLFGMLKESSGRSLTMIILDLFNQELGRTDNTDNERHRDLNPRHLLDLLRSSLIPSGLELRPPQSLPKNIHCATVIRKKGIKIKAGDSLGLSNIHFKNGVLRIPRLIIDDFSQSAILNCIAYEQCYTGLGLSMYINAYAAILDALVNTADDIRLLRDKDVIEHYYGTDDEVALFCNNLGKAFPLDAGIQFFGGLFEDINMHCRNSRKVQWAGFKQTYFGTPWMFLSALAAVILLILTLAQTFFSAYGYFVPPV